MLVLSRKPGEKILIGDKVQVTVVRIGPNTVRLGIDAPRDMNIAREELQPKTKVEPVEEIELTITDEDAATFEVLVTGSEPCPT